MLIVVERRETFHYYYPMGVHPPGDLTVTLKKMALHTLEGYYGDSAVVLKEFLTNAKTPDEISTAIQAFCDTYPDNNFAYFISFRKDVVHG